MNLFSLKIVAIDISYRDTGLCVLTKTRSSSSVDKAVSFPNPAIGQIRFNTISTSSLNMREVVKRINNIIYNEVADIVIIEMPSFTQNAKAAVAIGICWGSIHSVVDPFFVDSKFLKDWSESKAGDKKAKVRSKVSGRMPINPPWITNDNIVDAVGLAFATSDLISYENVLSSKQDGNS